ncbi:transglycosylase domain-containing protein [Anaeromicropila populeti]|uniref:Penicillin-binding protein 1A n=1 Tax=Anaeromicropila populeti TaxID=37658 RepID=A0A1I6IXI5_9FIRM|nr:transglycosylase domain-containing protein [Anaeromicropila populeti]SFR71462.1 penicillin-binding protein, 1A family [Anaeromicropila populeti]
MGKKLKKKKRKHSRGYYIFTMAFKITFLITLMIGLIGGVWFYFAYGKDILQLQKEAKILVRESSVDTFRQTETSLVYGANGKLLMSMKGEKDSYYIAYEDIPDEAKQAMIAIEDKNFTIHHGVDWKGVMRAAWMLVKHRGQVTQGASTITQQLSRNIFLTHEVSWERKIKEMFIAFELEKKYSKAQILEFYLNNIYFANGYYGIQAASKGYFNVTVDKLSLSQIAFLCAIPNNPTLYDPIDHLENTLKRRDRILYQMKTDKWIVQEIYEDAIAETIELDVKSVSKKNYVATYIIYCATRALMSQNGFEFKNEFSSEDEKAAYETSYSDMYTQCQQSLYSGGYRIYTSIDMTKQKKLQNAVNEELKSFDEKSEDGIYKLQGAAVSIENKTGRVVAIVGGRNQKSVGYTLNRGFQSFRQPGSSIKPLVVYTPAFELGYTPNSKVKDEKLKDGPKNSDNTYLGVIPIRTAVAKSKNTIAWKLFEEITPKAGLAYVLKMNFAKIQESDYGLASALGGLTIGASPVEMASGYAALENDGVYREPTCIVKITDAQGYEIVPEQITKKRIYEKNASRMMVSCMNTVMTSGTGAGIKLSNMTCAGKTGTTNDKKDGWFVGFTRYYTTSVWVGYDIPQTLSDLQGASYPGRIWKAYMEWLHEDLEDKPFEEYEDTKDEKNEVQPTEEEIDYKEEDMHLEFSEEPEEEAPEEEWSEEGDEPIEEPLSTDGVEGYGGDVVDEPEWDEDENEENMEEEPDEAQEDGQDDVTENSETSEEDSGADTEPQDGEVVE